MFLHHLITVTLIVLSYMSCHCYIGILVLWLHDWSDLFIGAIRTVMDCCGTKPTVGIYACLMVTWIYSRCYCMPFVVMPSIFKAEHHYILNQDFTGMFCFTMLIILSILNFYWCFLLMRMGYRVAVTGYATDLQNKIGVNVEDKEISE